MNDESRTSKRKADLGGKLSGIVRRMRKEEEDKANASNTEGTALIEFDIADSDGDKD